MHTNILIKSTAEEINADFYCQLSWVNKVKEKKKYKRNQVFDKDSIESKAQMHFRQLAFLAGKIGRTIVLPNVHHSHMGACLSHPFSFYYDQKRWLKSTKKHFDWITMNDFQTWINERQTVGAQPTGQEIYIEGSQKSGYLYKQKNCFQSLFDFTNRPIVSYQLADISHPVKKDGNITQTMMTLLSDEAREYEYLGKSDGPVDVINLFYDRRFFI